MKRRQQGMELVIGIVGAMAVLFLLVFLQRQYLMALALPWRMLAMVLSYWLIALVPYLVMRLSGDTWAAYGFSSERVGRQIGIGLAIAVLMSLVFTLLPHGLGLSAFVDNGRRYTKLWQFLFNFFYAIGAVAAVEEFIYRGFAYRKLQNIFSSETVAILGSSVLFGLFHLASGNGVQLIVTTLFGVLFCVLRLKIKGCTTLSLIVAHGVYDALISVWASLLLD